MAVANSIFLYNGEGANSTCVEETALQLKGLYGSSSVLLLDASYFERESSPTLYVLPGGGAALMEGELSSSAIKIRNAVYKGSGFLGLCAGAMFGSSSWHYHVPVDSEDSLEEPLMIGEKEYLLDLGPIAQAPAIHDPNFLGIKHMEQDLSRMAPIYLPEQDKVMRCFWNQGPGFSDWRGKMIAEYRCPINPVLKANNRDTLLAITHSRIGQGNGVFTGVHPELARWANAHGYPLSEEEIKANEELFKLCCTLAGASLSQ